MLGLTCLKEFSDWANEHEQECRRNGLRNTLLVGLSATASEQDQIRAFSYGMHFFCPKPTNTEVMTIIISQMKECATLEDAISSIYKATSYFKTGIRYPPVGR